MHEDSWRKTYVQDVKLSNGKSLFYFIVKCIYWRYFSCIFINNDFHSLVNTKPAGEKQILSEQLFYIQNNVSQNIFKAQQHFQNKILGINVWKKAKKWWNKGKILTVVVKKKLLYTLSSVFNYTSTYNVCNKWTD